MAIISSGFLMSCDGSSKTSKVEEVVNESENRSQARSVIEHRKLTEDKPMAIMVANYWEYEFVYKKQKMSAEGEHAGEWIKFEDDFTYTYGKYDDVQGSGTFHHSFDNYMLVLLDDKKNVEPVEYETKFGQEVMILVGRPTFGQNGSQMKMRKIMTRPTKSN